MNRIETSDEAERKSAAYGVSHSADAPIRASFAFSIPSIVAHSLRAASLRPRRGAKLRPALDREFIVEPFDIEDFAAYASAWRNLSDRALESNVFMDPGFAMPAALHMPRALRPQFIAIWSREANGLRGRLLAIWTLEGKTSMLSPGLGRAWRFRHAVLGAPLIDKNHGDFAIRAFFDWLRRARPDLRALHLAYIPQDGALFPLLLKHARETHRPYAILNAHERAILIGGQSWEALRQNRLSAKKRKEYKRQKRRLGEIGELKFGVAHAARDLNVRLEQFLYLEQKGWKGEKNTSLLSNLADSTFARAMVRMLGEQNRCEIIWLSLNDAPIAMGIILKSGARAYFWKSAYDENYASYSPGAILALLLTERQCEFFDGDMTDSCAVPDHPMINHFWRDRIPLADFIVALSSERAHMFDAIVQRERIWRKLRETAKLAAAKALGARKG